MTKRRLLRILVTLLFTYLLGSVLLAVVVAESALHPGRRAWSPAAENAMSLQLESEGSLLVDVSIHARDGAFLQGWYVRPLHTNGDTVILLHGLGDNRLGMMGYADLFLAHGYSVLMPDARGHGASGGEVATYGLLEQNDIERWFDWTRTMSPDHCIYGFGESMGAAQLLQALPVSTAFCAVAAESPFSTFREIAYDRMGQGFRSGPWLGRTVLRPLVDCAFLYARWKYHLNLERVSPEDAVAATTVPVLLIHGQDDNNIPVRHSRKISARNSSVELWEVRRAGHSGAFAAAPQEFPTKLLDFFASHSAR